MKLEESQKINFGMSYIDKEIKIISLMVSSIFEKVKEPWKANLKEFSCVYSGNDRIDKLKLKFYSGVKSYFKKIIENEMYSLIENSIRKDAIPKFRENYEKLIKDHFDSLDSIFKKYHKRVKNSSVKLEKLTNELDYFLTAKEKIYGVKGKKAISLRKKVRNQAIQSFKRKFKQEYPGRTLKEIRMGSEWVDNVKDDEDQSFYSGIVNKGTQKPNGIGVRVWPNGTTYQGFFKEGELDTYGYLKKIDGIEYLSGFKGGKFFGHWLEIQSACLVHNPDQGIDLAINPIQEYSNINEGYESDEGGSDITIYFSDRSIMKGPIEDIRTKGGIASFKTDNFEYNGNFSRHCKYEGYGEALYKDQNNSYKGYFFKDRFDTSKVEGQSSVFIWGDKGYKLRLKSTEGDKDIVIGDVKYTGDYKDGFKHGHGVLVFIGAGFGYEGEWKYDRPHGEGRVFKITDKQEKQVFVEGIWESGYMEYNRGRTVDLSHFCFSGILSCLVDKNIYRTYKQSNNIRKILKSEFEKKDNSQMAREDEIKDTLLNEKGTIL